MPDNNQRNLILLTLAYPPENSSGVQRAVRFAKYLAGPQRRVFVVGSSHAGEGTEDPQVRLVPNASLAAPAWQCVLARRIQRVLPYNECLDWTPHAIAAAEAIMREVPISEIVSTSPPLASHFAAWWLARQHKVKWVADFRDPISRNINRTRWWGHPYDAFLERRFFGAADAVLAVTDVVAAGWSEKYPHWRSKFRVIWNGFDPADGFGSQPIPLSPRRTLAHVGALYLQRYPAALISALARLIENGHVDSSGIRLLFLGPMLDRPAFERLAGAQMLIEHGCLEIRPERVPREEANRVISTSEGLLLLDVVDLSNTGYTVPAKLYDYILTGRPVLAVTNAGSPTARILAQSGIAHICLHAGDSEAEVERKVLEFLAFSSEPQTPSDWFFENFDGKRQAGTLAVLLDSLHNR